MSLQSATNALGFGIEHSVVLADGSCGGSQ